jgi:hypothetical protein
LTLLSNRVSNGRVVVFFRVTLSREMVPVGRVFTMDHSPMKTLKSPMVVPEHYPWQIVRIGCRTNFGIDFAEELTMPPHFLHVSMRMKFSRTEFQWKSIFHLHRRNAVAQWKACGVW